MSRESTITYYEIPNKEIAKALGGFHSAKIMMYNVDFAELDANMSSGNWDGNAKILSDAAKRLEGAIIRTSPRRLATSLWSVDIQVRISTGNIRKSRQRRGFRS